MTRCPGRHDWASNNRPSISTTVDVPAVVAETDGKIVATGAGLIIPEHKIVALFGAGTLKPYRGRGLQTAILQRRLEVAAQAGCEYAVIVTQGGTTSMRNAERLGFTLAYSKATLIKELKS